MVTGMNGTVAPVLGKRLRAEGIEVIPWDREKVATDDLEAITAFFDEVRPHWFFQIATGSPDWIETTARICLERAIRFLHTGSVSVFSSDSQGPFTVKCSPDATDDYGRYKIECEQRVVRANPRSITARLGWQIGEAPGSNNMVDFLSNAMREKGHIEASRAWKPSCCYLQDTAEALLRLIKDNAPGLYQVEGNPGLSFFEIVQRLNKKDGGTWKVIPTDNPDWDNRMLDDRVKVTPITATLAQ